MQRKEGNGTPVSEDVIELLSILRQINVAVKKEFEKKTPSRGLLDSYSNLYSSIGSVMKLYGVTRIRFSLTRWELAILMIWFAGAVSAITLAKQLWAFGGSDLINVLFDWTAVLIALLGVSTLPKLKS